MSLIYVIEDDETLRDELGRLLELSGYQVRSCDTFSTAAQDALDARPDCVLLDLKLPGNDGLSVCRDIRTRDKLVPVIMITSSDSEFDEVMSMNLGADDYVTKPYRPAVLLARLRSVLRRNALAEEPNLSHREVELDASRAVVSYRGADAELTRNELRILRALMQSPGTVISRQEIMVELWESDAFIDDNTLTVNVNRLRRKLSSIGAPDDFLATKRGMGYMV